LRRNGGGLVSSRGKTSSLTRGVDTSHLHGDCGEARGAHDEHDDERRNREGRLDGDAARLIA
jgi:hypothetical protein